MSQVQPDRIGGRISPRRSSSTFVPSDDQPTLRVMRLLKPSLSVHNAIPSFDTIFDSVNEELRDAGPTCHSAEGDFILGSFLRLPESFGSIYLGENFTAYISVVNSIPQQHIADVDLKVRLQCPSSKIDLGDVRQQRGGGPPAKNPVPVLLSGQRLDMIVECKLQELSTHTLRVTVLYRDVNTLPGQEPRTLTKFYRFNVLSPFEIITTCSIPKNIPLVQISVKNTSDREITLQSYDLVTTPECNFSSSLLGKKPEAKNRDEATITAIECFDSVIILSPNDSCRFLYRIQGKKQLQSNSEWKLPFASHNLGHFELKWNSAMGEGGAIASPPIVCNLEPKRGVQVVFEGLKSSMKLYTVETVTAVVTNLTYKSMMLQLQFRSESMAGIYIEGRSYRNLGEVKPLEEKRCEVQLIPLLGGLHEIRGCFVVDTLSSVEFPQEDLGSVFVEW